MKSSLTTSLPNPFPQPYTQVTMKNVTEFIFSKKANQPALTDILKKWFPKKLGIVPVPEAEIFLRYIEGNTSVLVNQDDPISVTPEFPLQFLNQQDIPGPSYQFRLLSIVFPVIFQDKGYMFMPYRFTDNPLLRTWEREFLGLPTAAAEFNFYPQERMNSLSFSLKPILPRVIVSEKNQFEENRLVGSEILKIATDEMKWGEKEPKTQPLNESFLTLRQYQALEGNGTSACISQLVSIDQSINVHLSSIHKSFAGFNTRFDSGFKQIFPVSELLSEGSILPIHDEFEINYRTATFNITAPVILKKQVSTNY